MTRNAEDFESAIEQGMDPEGLRRLMEVVERDIEQERYDGAVMVVARDGVTVLHEAVGYSDRANGRKATTDDVFFLMSITKTFTGALVLAAIDRGDIGLHTPVAEVLPEFGVKGKQRVTVFHLLTHTGGVSSGFPALLPLDQVGNLSAYVAAAANEPLAMRPGSMVQYSPFTAHAVLAEMLRRLEGGERSFRQMLAEDLFKPLRMRNTALGRRPDLSPRLAPVVYRDQTPGLFEPIVFEALNALFAEDTEIPAGGAIGTASDLAIWADTLLHAGERDGARILSPAILDLAINIHTGTMPNHLFDYALEMYGWDPFPANLGLSFFVRGEGQHVMPFGATAAPSTFGGLGAGSTMFWVDPERDLVFALVTAGLLEEGHSFLRHQKISDLVLAAALD